MPTEIFTWYWFFSVIVVGLLINLASAYLKTPMDRVLSKASSRWRARVERKLEEHAEIVHDNLKDPTLLLITGLKLVRSEARAYFFVLMTVLAVFESRTLGAKSSFGELGALFFSVLCAFLASSDFYAARRLKSILEGVEFCRLEGL